MAALAVYQNHEVAEGKSIHVSDQSESIDFVSDSRLLIRILGNMVKNALEAESSGQVVTIGARQKANMVQFWVRNPNVMPDQVKRQLFQRSFSTKGSGRGLGTYSIKLLGEKYLKGRVHFVSEPDQGTVFYIDLPMESV